MELFLATCILQVFTFAAFIPILPLILVVMIVTRVYRQSKKVMIKVRARRTTKVDNCDSIWLMDTLENRAIINGLMTLSGQLPIERVRQLILTRMIDVKDDKGRPVGWKFKSVVIRRFRSLLWAKDERFDIEAHVKQYEGAPIPDDRDLHRVVSDFSSQDLDWTRPLWQVITIPMADGRSVLLLRLHHCIGDGIVLMRLILRNLGDSPLEAIRPKRPPARFSHRVMQALWEAPHFMLRLLTAHADYNRIHSHHRSRALRGVKRVAVSAALPLDELKVVGRRHGATVNDVLMAALSGALRRYFQAKSLPLPQGIAAFIPVSVRGGEQDALHLDNKSALVVLDLPLQTSDPAERLAEVRENTTRLKGSADAAVSFAVMNFCLYALPEWAAKGLFRFITTKASMVLSNVPGPTAEMRIDGLRVEAMTFFPPARDDIGLSVSIMSYSGKVFLGVMSDEASIKEPQELVDCFVKSINFLKRACVQKEE